MKSALYLATVAVALCPHVGCAQGPPKLNPARQQAIIEKTIEHVLANYVFPEKAKAVESTLRANVQSGRYTALTGPDAFLDALNHDMQAAGQDKHLRLIYSPRMAAQLKQDAEGMDAVDPEFLAMLRENNFRLRKAESLEGNIGYFKFDNFVELRFVKDAFVGAMNFLHSSSAMILDLRDNGGGAAETSNFLLSYFLPEGTHTMESWERRTDETRVTTVTRAPEVEPLLEAPLFVLVSERTASAAEATAYTLQQAKRAVIIGATTKGMANSGQQFLIDDALLVMVPTIQNRNPISGTNWEGVGVVPDLAIAPDEAPDDGLDEARTKAFDTAIEQALHALADRKTDKKEQYRLRFLAEPYTARVSPQSPPAGFLDACLGAYEDGQRIVLQDGSLHYTKGEINRRMRYMRDGTFTVEGRTDYRLRFTVAGGQVERCDVLWFDDTSDSYKRVE